MNQKARYEQLIAEKLDALPVPDMADSIWARIEGLLDTDMPTDDGDVPEPDVPGSGGGVGSHALLFATVLAVMSLFTIPQKNIQHLPALSPQNNLPVQNASPPPLQSAARPLVTQTAPPAVVTNAPDTGFAGTALLPVADTLNANPPLVQQWAPPVAGPPVQDSVPKKRPRGVTGIGDNDYRIVPKKDSSQP